MNVRRRNIPTSEAMRKALDEAGGEPLEGSGFEKKTPEAEFTAESREVPDPRR